MSPRTLAVALAVGLAIVVDAFVVAGAVWLRYPSQANTFPMIAAAALTILAILLVLNPAASAAGDDAAATATAPPATGADIRAFLLMVAVLPALYLAGFRVGLPLYALVYALSFGARPWQAGLTAAVIALAIETLFVRVLTLRLPSGVLGAMLG